MTGKNGPVPGDMDDGLYFLPLGGTEEIGLNLYLYGIDGHWLMVDCGIAFGDETTPGVDIIVPDLAFIEQRREDLVGLVLTHGHEDHLGAVQYLWPQLRCPVYATPFTAAYLRLKLRETDFGDQVQIIELPLSGGTTLGPFGIELVTMTHSIPEPNAVVIRTRLGTVVHSGDWKLDPTPVIGEATDAAKLHEIGRDGVTATPSTVAVSPADNPRTPSSSPSTTCSAPTRRSATTRRSTRRSRTSTASATRPTPTTASSSWR